ncbi:MAG: flagellar assembly protein FliW [Firmicutes bacterium]|nr:flagellar assembly protein FliW [Bacillota bacterium]
MFIQTKYFGQIACKEEERLLFPKGLFGFEDERDFLLLPFHGSAGTLLCFQSMATPALAFVGINPFALKPDYAPELTEEELAQLHVKESEELSFYTLCAVREPVANSTVNLRCPIAVNEETREAMQVILDTEIYQMRHLLSELSKGEGDDLC